MPSNQSRHCPEDQQPALLSGYAAQSSAGYSKQYWPFDAPCATGRAASPVVGLASSIIALVAPVAGSINWPAAEGSASNAAFDWSQIPRATGLVAATTPKVQEFNIISNIVSCITLCCSESRPVLAGATCNSIWVNAPSFGPIAPTPTIGAAARLET